MELFHTNCSHLESLNIRYTCFIQTPSLFQNPYFWVQNVSVSSWIEHFWYYPLKLNTIQWLIGWDSQKVNAEHPLHTNHFRHTYVITWEDCNWCKITYICLLKIHDELKLCHLNLILMELDSYKICWSTGFYFLMNLLHIIRGQTSWKLLSYFSKILYILSRCLPYQGVHTSTSQRFAYKTACQICASQNPKTQIFNPQQSWNAEWLE